VSGQTTTLQVNDVLDLELWVTLDEAISSAGYSYDLETSTDGVISLMSPSVSSPWTGMFGLQVNGTDNVANDDVTPLSGSFGRTVVASPMAPEPFPQGSTLLATFSVIALAPGQVSYGFDPGAGLRDWQMGLASGGSTDLAAATPALTMTVLPEPGAAGMMLIAAAWIARRRRHSVGA
jgi:hypothetical protein